MKTRTKQILGIMKILSWIVFFGLCIETGAILYSFFVSLFINPEAAKNLYAGLDLSDLKSFSVQHYSIVALLVAVLLGLRAYMLYLVIKMFLKINLMHPFSTDVARLVAKISYVAVFLGILAIVATEYSDWLIKKGLVMPKLQEFVSGGAGFLFLGGIIFIISQIFKRGIEIQTENELTV